MLQSEGILEDLHETSILLEICCVETTLVNCSLTILRLYTCCSEHIVVVGITILTNFVMIYIVFIK